MGFRPEEVDRLKRVGIVTLEQFWQQLAEVKSGTSPGQAGAMEDFSRKTGIAPDRLISVLADGVHPQRPNVFSFSVILSVCLVLILMVRTAWLLASPGSTPLRAIIAARDLRAGDTLYPGDVCSTWLPPREAGFPSAGVLQGLVVRHSLPRGRLIHYDDVSRQQVVVTRDLPPGAVLSHSDLSLTWAAFNPDAVLNMSDVFNRKTRFGLQKGQVVVPHLLMPGTR